MFILATIILHGVSTGDNTRDVNLVHQDCDFREYTAFVLTHT